MKVFSIRNKIPIFLILLILASSSIAGIYFYQKDKQKFLLKSETLPKTYQECDETYPKEGNFNPADYIFPICDYFVEESNSLYGQCMTYGGIKTEKICALCPGCGCTPAGCRLIYIDPNFVLPTDYNECRKVFTHSGGRSIDENEGREYCAILLPKQGVFNVDVGERLYKECLSQNGRISFGGSCELKFYED